MNKEILELSPKLLWNHFYQLTQIPRPSKKEEKVIGYVKNFGKKLGLETITDEVGNVIIRKPASAGYENRKCVVLQAHLDMVPQKNSDKNHDFEKDAIETYIEDGWVKANGTTLGADNGIGAAAALAVLEDDNILHGPIEALFTIDEETGMTGANNLQGGVLKGDILLNMDSEDEGELYVGCAGGSDANMVFTFRQNDVPDEHVAYKLKLTGLKGGHSGMDISTGRANANKLLFRFWKYAITHFKVRLSSVDGGSLRNAIPREAFAVITVDKNEVQNLESAIKQFEDLYSSEYEQVEPGLSFSAEPVDLPSFVMEEIIQDDLVNAIQACPNGVIRMSNDMEGLVETSLNLAVIKSDDNKVVVNALLRSSVDSAKADLESALESLFMLAGAKVWFDGQYPGWKPNMKSDILQVMQKVYKDDFGKVPAIKAIHAGLECGILGSAYPNWDMISFGPTIRYPHSPDEKVNIESVDKFWHFLVGTLKNVPQK